MKKAFKFAFTKTVIALCALLTVCLVAYVISSVVDMILAENFDGFRIMTAIAFIAVIILILFTLYKSRYEIKKDGLYVYVSVSIYKVDYEKITEVKHDRTTDKLFLIYYENGKRLSVNLQLKSEDYADFANSLKEEKPSILYVEE